MENILGRAWLLVAHESLIPYKNDLTPASRRAVAACVPAGRASSASAPIRPARRRHLALEAMGSLKQPQIATVALRPCVAGPD